MPSGPWYDPNQNIGSTAGGSQNEGNDLGSIFGQAGLAENSYFGGTPGGAAAATAYYTQQANQAGRQAAPQIGQAGMSTYDQQMGNVNAAYGQAGNANMGAQRNQQTAFGTQQAALGNLAQAASGKGPSAAQGQLQAGLEQGINANMAMANSARGQAGTANAQKNALGQNAMMAGQSANQAAQLRAQEMQAAQSQYAQGASQLGQNANQAQNQYGQQQLGFAGLGMQGAAGYEGHEQNQAQLQAGQNSLNQQGQLAYQQLGFNAQAQNMQAAMNNQNQANQLNQANAKNAEGAAGGILGAVGSVAGMFSDRRGKDNIRDAGPKLDEALNHMGAYQYEYKPGLGQAAGTQTGTMAQDLASTDAGRNLVGMHPTGAMGVKIPEATSFALASVARLNERINNLQRGGVYGDMQFQEPGGGDAAWTIREEPDFLLAKNDRTGALRKIVTEPLSADEHHQAVSRPHGAGPIDGRRVAAPSDGKFGDAMAGATGAGASQAGAQLAAGFKGDGSGPTLAPKIDPNAAMAAQGPQVVNMQPMPPPPPQAPQMPPPQQMPPTMNQKLNAASSGIDMTGIAGGGY